MARVAPKSVILKFCPVCGRDDRFMGFVGEGHFSRGKRCPGTLKTVIYKRTLSAELLSAVHEVIQEAEALGDEPGANLIRDILVPAWTEYEVSKGEHNA